MRWAFILLLFPSIACGQPLAATVEGGSRPVPDPTLLTTQAQEKAIAAQRELFEAKIEAIQLDLARIKATLDTTDARLIKRLDDIPNVIDASISHQQQLTNEKFKGVDQQFQGRDVALAAALLAQKTSVDEQNKANAASSAKAEGATTKQIDGIQSIIAANSKATDDKIDGVKALVLNQAKSTDDKIADLRSSIVDLRSRGAGQSDLWGYIGVALGVMISIITILMRFGQVSHKPEPQIVYVNGAGSVPPITTSTVTKMT